MLESTVMRREFLFAGAIGMTITHIRHATCIIEFHGLKFLLDPILYKKHTLKPIAGGINEKNPLVDIATDNLKDIDCILLTHLHMDHFDPGIVDFFGKDIPVVFNAAYEKQMMKLGLSRIYPVSDSVEMNGITIITTKGQHGTGLVGKLMGNSYGFVLDDQDGNKLYIPGDTVWCKRIENAIEKHAPQHIVVFSGSAMVMGNHITMNEADINEVLRKAPNAKVIAIHMEAWNHCRLTRKSLRKSITNDNLFIPEDEEKFSL
jgi:L-ascorbate metabolism protein UlaG (beta-lactamase superfamily)